MIPHFFFLPNIDKTDFRSDAYFLKKKNIGIIKKFKTIHMECIGKNVFCSKVDLFGMCRYMIGLTSWIVAQNFHQTMDKDDACHY